jgi:hypothetical protein
LSRILLTIGRAAKGSPNAKIDLKKVFADTAEAAYVASVGYGGQRLAQLSTALKLTSIDQEVDALLD